MLAGFTCFQCACYANSAATYVSCRRELGNNPLDQLERRTTEHINFSLCHNRSEYPTTCQSRFHPLELSLAVVSCLADLIIVAVLITRSHRAEFCCSTAPDGPVSLHHVGRRTWTCCRLRTSRGVL